MPRAVITGVGVVSPFGIGWQPWLSGLQNAVSATRRIALFNPDFPVPLNPHIAALPCQIAAEVPDFDPSLYLEPRDVERVPRVVPLALCRHRPRRSKTPVWVS